MSFLQIHHSFLSKSSIVLLLVSWNSLRCCFSVTCAVTFLPVFCALARSLFPLLNAEAMKLRVWIYGLLVHEHCRSQCGISGNFFFAKHFNYTTNSSNLPQGTPQYKTMDTGLHPQCNCPAASLSVARAQEMSRWIRKECADNSAANAV